MIGLLVCTELRSAGQPRAAVPSQTCFLFRGLSAIRLARPEVVSKVLGCFFGCSFGSSVCSSVGAAHMKRGFFDDLAQGVQMFEGFFGRGVAKDYGELLASAAEGLAVAGDFGQARGHHAQDLVACVVSVGVVELFEVVDVDYGDGILLVEGEEGLVEGAASTNAGEFVVVGEHVGRLDERGGEDEGGGGDIGVRHFADWGELQPNEYRCHGPDKAGLDGLAGLNKTPYEYRDSSHKT